MINDITTSLKPFYIIQFTANGFYRRFKDGYKDVPTQTARIEKATRFENFADAQQEIEQHEMQDQNASIKNVVVVYQLHDT